jgi:hypothetical protein
MNWMRVSCAFLSLVALQAAHSIEEYAGRLYDVFPPARFVSGLFSNDHRTGFIVFNVLLVAFGFWATLGPVWRSWRGARSLIAVWLGIEFLNGLGHPIWSLVGWRYTPGVATAPLLLGLSCYIAWQLRLRTITPSDQHRP